MMYSTNVTLDGMSNGIGAFIRSKNNWIKRSDNKTNLFTNFKTLEARLLKEELDYHDVSFCFIIQDKVTGKATISLNEAIKTDNGWKVSRYETIYGQLFLHIYDIKEVDNEQVVSIGYISTNKAGTHDSNKDPKYEYAKLKHIRSISLAASTKIVEDPMNKCSLKKTRQGLEIRINNTSATIYIWSNGKLMDYNTDVKKRREMNEADGTRCLPYTKDKDKYGTLYMFATCDESDAQDLSYTVQLIERIEQEIVAMMKVDNPDDEVTYIPCNYQGKVLLNLSSEEA